MARLPATAGPRLTHRRALVRTQRYRLATNMQPTTVSPRIELLTAVRRHWFVAIVPVVVLVAAAVAIGSKRPVKYTTTANLSIGHVYVSNPVGIPTIIEATQALAAVYSRAINSGAVVQDTRRRLRRVHVLPVAGSLSATPIPQSPLIKVSAQSESQPGAIALANAGAAALAAYVNRQVRDNSASATIAARYLQASLAYRQSLATSKRLARRYTKDPNAASKAARDRAAAATDTAQLRRDALSASYQAAVQGGASSVGVDVFSQASGTTSDRSQMMQILVFVGLVGGLAAGAALALLRASRDLRRGR
jgi:capsular polysaccharide biosynthesis protein